MGQIAEGKPAFAWIASARFDAPQFQSPWYFCSCILRHRISRKVTRNWYAAVVSSRSSEDRGGSYRGFRQYWLLAQSRAATAASRSYHSDFELKARCKRRGKTERGCRQ